MCSHSYITHTCRRLSGNVGFESEKKQSDGLDLFYPHQRTRLIFFFFFMWRIMSLISTVHLTWNQQEQQHWSCSRLLWMSLVCFLACLLCVSVCVHVCLWVCVCNVCIYACGAHVFWRPYCDESEVCIATAPREGVDDRRAPLTRGFEEAAVTLYPVNSEYIVLERGC